MWAPTSTIVSSGFACAAMYSGTSISQLCPRISAADTNRSSGSIHSSPVRPSISGTTSGRVVSLNWIVVDCPFAGGSNVVSASENVCDPWCVSCGRRSANTLNPSSRARRQK